MHDHADGFLHRHHFQHVFQRQRLEVQAIGSVIVGRYRLGIAVDHDGLVAVFTHRQRGMHAAIVKFDTLTDAVRPAPQHHDFFVAGRLRLAFFLVGRIHIGGVGGKLGSAGIHALEHRAHAQRMAVSAHRFIVDTQQFSQSRIGETAAF